MPIGAKAPSTCSGLQPSIVSSTLTQTKALDAYDIYYSCGDKCTAFVTGDNSDVQNVWKEFLKAAGTAEPYCTGINFVDAANKTGISLTVSSAAGRLGKVGLVSLGLVVLAVSAIAI
ncbi:hypothetical protein HDU97_007540 [Phlyctochytrium planicorne]|nr:hypothetical protein HDU97_007540 [Phlyctochytrium planicorne]